jgi:hypothetical protein
VGRRLTDREEPLTPTLSPGYRGEGHATAHEFEEPEASRPTRDVMRRCLRLRSVRQPQRGVPMTAWGIALGTNPKPIISPKGAALTGSVN